ncbi:ras GTPase-activating protein 1-like [Zophobas morio]|uniref:ras GTPase-activating protein 1-like n=1 Tax=Zophobas morio TaxID=2755281 RepID=UPI0030829651
MRMEIEKKFSSEKDAVYSLLNSFVFLRFLVTCILNPKKFGVCLSISDDKLKLAARNLELIGKTLQGIVNMLPMGLKEAYLGVLNPLAARLIPEMKLFIDRISTDHGNTKMPSLENLICPCNTIEKVKVGVQDGETFAKHLSKLSRVFYQARERVYASNMVRKIPALKGPLSDIFSVLEKIYD